MLCKTLIVLNCVLTITIHTNGQNYYNQNYGYNPEQTYYGYGNEVVTIQLYYEAMCPACRHFYTHALKQTVLELGQYLDIRMYPYGNAKTIDKGYGYYEFESQHGPVETYGNKLHACAIDALQNMTIAVLYNSCMMDDSRAGKGSDDAAADVCGRFMGINSGIIKQRAKSDRGSQLLKLYGDESKKAGFKTVPTVLVNGVPARTDHFKEDVCKAFRNPPSQCFF